MLRLRRLHFHGGYYHVMLRGNHREPLFTRSADHDPLNDIVADVIKSHQTCQRQKALLVLVRKQLDDPAGRGHEMVKELQVCLSCTEHVPPAVLSRDARSAYRPG
jgi:hypothetical protein